MTRSRRLAAACGLAAALVGSAGCFQYVPAEIGALPAGRDVRVELTRVGFAELPEFASWGGPGLSGKVAGASGLDLLLRVPVAVRRDGLVTQVIEQNLAVPTRHVVSVQRREFSRTRSALVAASALALVGVIATSFDSGPPAIGGMPEPKGEPEAGSGLSISISF